jgi:hypothetical protein
MNNNYGFAAKVKHWISAFPNRKQPNPIETPFSLEETLNMKLVPELPELKSDEIPTTTDSVVSSFLTPNQVSRPRSTEPTRRNPPCKINRTKSANMPRSRCCSSPRVKIHRPEGSEEERVFFLAAIG